MKKHQSAEEYIIKSEQGCLVSDRRLDDVKIDAFIERLEDFEKSLKFFIIKWTDKFDPDGIGYCTIDVYTYYDDGKNHRYYDFDVYGGHIETSYVLTASRCSDRSEWTISGEFKVHYSILSELIKLIKMIKENPDDVYADITQMADIDAYENR